MAAIAAVHHDEFDFITGLINSDAETEDQQLGAVDVQLSEKMPPWSMRSLSALGRWLDI